ncbi:MAG: hypothetical protein NVSMB69_00080 [Novosphingobium sp.]
MLAEPSRIECALWAALGAVLAGFARAALGGLANSAPFVTFLPFALITATFLGWRWGLFYILCASAVIVVFFPSANLFRQGMTVGTFVFFLVFVASCGLLIAMGDALRSVIRDLAKAHGEIEQLSRELFHRGQNTITVVQALMRLSSRTEGLTVESYRDALIDRLHALAKANTLFGRRDQSTDLAALVELAVSPFAGAHNVAIAGPPCTLQPQACQPMALVLHELSTNALKHGALSRPDGRVDVRWTLDADGQLAQFHWTESGGPPVVAPSRKGMGSSLLASMRQLNPDVQWHAQGLVCRLSVPIVAAGAAAA